MDGSKNLSLLFTALRSHSNRKEFKVTPAGCFVLAHELILSILSVSVSYCVCFSPIGTWFNFVAITLHFLNPLYQHSTSFILWQQREHEHLPPRSPFTVMFTSLLTFCSLLVRPEDVKEHLLVRPVLDPSIKINPSRNCCLPVRAGASTVLFGNVIPFLYAMQCYRRRSALPSLLATGIY